nr:MAG: putative RNA-dependent RNA polymerase [Mitoviridae sp.]
MQTAKLNNPKRLFNKSTVYLSIGLIPKYIRFVVWILDITVPGPYHLLGDRIISLIKLSGLPFTVMYLKEALRIIQKFISGEKLKETDGIRMGLSHGLPRILPASLRDSIRASETREIRAILTIVSLFRVMQCEPKLKLETITSPFKGMSPDLPKFEVMNVLKELKPLAKSFENTLHISMAAGPNKNPAALGLSLDAFALKDKPELLESIKTLSSFSSGFNVYEALLNEINLVKDLIPIKDPILSKLSLKEEAAGKVRVFAILDSWTQSALTGLHKSLGHILSNIEQDGTYDQSKPLYNLMKKELNDLYSFDLNAATDRLPIHLQTHILSFLYGRDLAEAWRVLVSERDFQLKSSKFKLDLSLRYAVGQPMGCLSSFNMLGLTHHVIVQIAARRVGFQQWFTDYALLGDDIVIGNSLVANSYSNIMFILGLDISPSKSLVSHKGVCEFAKRLISHQNEYSPIGPRNIVQAMKTWTMVPSLFVDLMGKGWTASVETVEQLVRRAPISFMGSREKRREAILRTLQGPFGFISLGTRLTSEIQIINSFNPQWLGNALGRIRFAMFKLHSKEWEKSISLVNTLLGKVEYEWGEWFVPGFSQSHSDSSLNWRYFPSYCMIHNHYQNGYDRLVRAKPILNPFGLFSADMMSVYTGVDVITPEFKKESPAAMILADMFSEEPSFFKERLGTTETRFWQHISDQEFSGESAQPFITPLSHPQQFTKGEKWVNPVSGFTWDVE